MTKPEQKHGFLDRLLKPQPDKAQEDDTDREITLQPALRQIGITDCPICKHEVAAFLTKTNRPFVNCGFCSARIFYNGRQSIRLLKKKMQVVEDE